MAKRGKLYWGDVRSSEEIEGNGEKRAEENGRREKGRRNFLIYIYKVAYSPHGASEGLRGAAQVILPEFGSG